MFRVAQDTQYPHRYSVYTGDTFVMEICQHGTEWNAIHSPESPESQGTLKTLAALASFAKAIESLDNQTRLTLSGWLDFCDPEYTGERLNELIFAACTPDDE